VVTRKRGLLIVLSSWLAMIVACSFPLFKPTPAPGSGAGGAPVTLPSLTPSSIPATPAAPTDTPVPVPTSPPTVPPTATLSAPVVSPLSKDVPCLFGPGSVYSTEGVLASGHTVPIQGRDSAGGWWYIENPSHPGRFCWVDASLTQTQGDISIVAVQPPPVTFVDYVGVEMSPKTVDIGPCVWPYTFSVTFSIEYNGPITFTFQRNNDGHTAPPETYTFKASGTQSYPDYVRVGSAGAHFFKVQVTSPNSLAGQASATVTCH